MDNPERVTVIGAGLMGHALGLVYALGGHAVGIYDSDPARLDDVATRARDTAAPLVASGVLEPAALDDALRRLVPFRDLPAALAGSHFVVEAVAENLALKQAVFAELDRLTDPSVILGSNTSALNPDDLAAVTRYPERVLITHWVNPPTLLPLVEVVRAEATSDSVVASVLAHLTALGKRPVVIPRYVPGFVVPRLQAALLRECLALVDDGVVSPSDVDDIVRFSLAPRWAALGVLRVVDFGNTNLFAAAARTIFPSLSKADGPGPTLTALAELGQHGVTTGQGFYQWTPEEIATARDLRDAVVQAVLALTNPQPPHMASH